MKQMKLYYHPLSTYSQKVLIAFHEKDLQFEPEIVQLMDPEARNRYRQIYPMGKVPMLMVEEDDHMIPESSIIIEYLDAVADPKLIPADPELARKTRFKERMFDFYLAESLGTLFFEGLKPEDARDPDRMDTAKYRIGVMYQFMDKDFSEHEYANGNGFSLADCAGAAALFYAPKLVPFDDKPNIVAYWERLTARPSIQQVHAEVAPHLEAFNKQHAA